MSAHRADPEFVRGAIGWSDGIVFSRVALHPVTPDTRPIVERLWQLYSHDMSEYRGTMPNADGTFPLDRLASFFGDPDRRAYLVYGMSRPVGLAFVRGLAEEPRVVGEFFVVRAARRQGIGRKTALELLRLHSGRWEIPFQEENPGAARFWRAVASDVAGNAWHEERRAVRGKPNIPPDVWIGLESEDRNTGPRPG